jgi:hypothetical protein
MSENDYIKKLVDEVNATLDDIAKKMKEEDDYLEKEKMNTKIMRQGP